MVHPPKKVQVHLQWLLKKFLEGTDGKVAKMKSSTCRICWLLFTRHDFTNIYTCTTRCPWHQHCLTHAFIEFWFSFSFGRDEYFFFWAKFRQIWEVSKVKNNMLFAIDNTSMTGYETMQVPNHAQHTSWQVQVISSRNM